MKTGRGVQGILGFASVLLMVAKVALFMERNYEMFR
jgi:hypothetical protein